ncbi:DUF4350 domain-containing protein [Iamia sp. SCSIO 61187]|uniref:DUF4350 domain-containing protein n=1 Tax=Iamia sp. SCSIO 61187 TaxID=2722752 RepID=UPI001C628A08|nr:DUF4350 domain-containing protein [Iamia sp. SCSIO 61187]QYG92389.1 DUF4350 domain-containing protein [Iamia sp. SCSIO 61187]
MTVTQAPGDHAGRDDGATDDPAGADGSDRRLAAWWSRTGPVKRLVVVIAVLVVGVNGAIAALDSVVGRDPGGPTGSSYATGDDGVAAWADLLRARGVDVTPRREPLGAADLPADGTVVLVEPDDAPTPEGVTALAEHLAGGGRVVAVGESGAAWAGALVGLDLGWTPDGTPRPGPTGPLLADLSALRGEGAGAFTAAGPLTPEAGPAEAPVVLTGGGLVAVADPTLLDNAHLAEADNAGLAVLLAGAEHGPVAFAEAEHGYGAARGLGALPWRWRLTALGLVVATLLGFWSVGQRLGPPEATDRPLAPPRRAHVDALGAALRRASTPAPPDRPPDPGGSP